MSTSAFMPREQMVSARLLLGLALVAALCAAGCRREDPPQPPLEVRRLVFTQQPSNAVAGEAMPDIQVTLQGQDGAPLDEQDVTVTLLLARGPAGATFNQLQVPLLAGVATFKGVTLTRAGADQAFEARTDSLRKVSAPFSISPAAATRLGIVSEPGDSSLDGPIGPPVQLIAQDAFGNPRSDATGEITASLVGGPEGALTGTTKVQLNAGVATFSELLVDAVGVHSLSFSAPGFTPVESRTFRVKPGAPVALGFTVQPSDVTAGQPVAPAFTVSLLDRKGNQSPEATASISLELATNPGGASLSGTIPVSAVAGVATFSNVKLNKAGSGYTLRAVSGSLQPATSAAFTVRPGSPARLGFVRQPVSAIAGATLAPVDVAVQDALGNATSATARITVALGANPGGDTLGGTLSVDAVNGVAHFDTLSLKKAGKSYTLAATAQGLVSGTSTSFDISPAAPAQLVFSVPPSNATAGAILAPAVQVRLLDAFDNPTSSALKVTLALGNNPGSGTLSGTTQAAPVASVATFNTLSVNKAASGYTLQATLGTLSATSPAFTITPSTPAAVVFKVQPPLGTAGVALSPAVEVEVRDAFGNPTDGTVTLALQSNPGSDTLQGTLTANTVAGVASFANLSLRKAAAGYALRASVPGTPGAFSRLFTIQAAAPSRIQFIRQPATRSALNAPLAPEPQLQAVDLYDNPATSFTGPISIALGNNPSAATLSGTLTVNASDGVATFMDLRIDKVGSGYTLMASSPGLLNTASGSFNVAAAMLTYTDPTTGKLRLVRNPASTDSLLVLDLIAAQDVTGYGVGFNLPVDASRVRLNSLVPGIALPAGSNPVAAKAALPASGPLKGILTSAQSQKASGPGAVTTDTLVPTGAVLYTLRLDLTSAVSGIVFDGATLSPAFNAAMRDKLGNDVVRRSEFGIGRLEVIAP